MDTEWIAQVFARLSWSHVTMGGSCSFLPYRLVRNHHLRPLLRRDLLCHRTQLLRDHLHRLPTFPLFQTLATAQNYPDAAVQRMLRLARHKVVTFSQNCPPLAVPQQRPGDVAVLQLLDGDLAGEGAVGPVEDILGRNFDGGVKVFAGQEEEEGRWGDDDFDVGVCGGNG